LKIFNKKEGPEKFRAFKSATKVRQICEKVRQSATVFTEFSHFFFAKFQ